MRTHFIVLLCVAAVALPRSAVALDLYWSRHATQVATTSAPCTLYVMSDGASPLPKAWHIDWVLSGVGNLTNPFATAAVTHSPDFLVTCEETPPQSPAAAASHADTVLECSPTAARTIAQYVIALPAGAAAKFRLVPAFDPAAQVKLTLESAQSEVAYGDAYGLVLPPLLTGAIVYNAGGDASLRVYGYFPVPDLTAEFRPSHSELRTVPLTLVSFASDHLDLKAPVGTITADGFLVIRDIGGRTSCLSVSPPPARAAPSLPHIVVRFQPGALALPPNTSSASTDQCISSNSALPSTLTSRGIRRLSKLFPAFHHDDIHSHNLLGEPILLEDLADIYICELDTTTDPEAAALACRTLPQVLYAARDRQGHANSPTSPTDPLYQQHQEWGLNALGAAPCGIMANHDVGGPGAWITTSGGPTARIAILDTGIDANHPDMRGAYMDTSFIGGPSPVDDNPDRHGTAVAGLAAGFGDDNRGMAGIAWRAQPWAIKVIDSTGTLTDSSVARGLDRVRLKGIPIANMSFGIPGCSPPTCRTLTDAEIGTVHDACLNAYLAGVFLVTSSGNALTNEYQQEMLYDPAPARFSQIVYAVGAYDPRGNRWKDSDYAGISFCSAYPGLCRSSNYGPWLDAIAPGGLFIAAPKNGSGPDSFYTTIGCAGATSGTIFGPQAGFGGTSAASPIAAGIAGLLKSINFTLVGEDFEHILDLTALPYDLSSGYDTEHGFGYLNAWAALNFVRNDPALSTSRLVAHGSLAAPALAVVDSGTGVVTRSFNQVPGISSGYTTATCRVYRLRGSVTYSAPFGSPPSVWTRGSGTLGWRDTTYYDHNYEVPWARFVPGTLTASGAQLETFVYRIISISGGGTSGWYPVPPSAARVAYTAIGGIDGRGVLVGDEATISFSIASFPNPSIASTSFSVRVPYRTYVRFSILDVAGRVVATLASREVEAGELHLRWNGDGAAGTVARPGVYWARAEMGSVLRTMEFVRLGGAR